MAAQDGRRRLAARDCNRHIGRRGAKCQGDCNQHCYQHFYRSRLDTGAGFFNISPLQPGTYTVQIAAKGFKTLMQDNVVVDALQISTISPVLAVGTESQTVTVTAAPPVLDTADATLGLTVENDTYSNLPIQSNGQQRDPTAFGTLTPGAQGGTRLPVIGGTGNYLGQLYLDGMPATTVNQQGDNRVVSLSMSIEAVDQFQVLTSTPPAEYMGAGAENFTMKSGGLKYHGQVSDFVRNTAFDTWGFTSQGCHNHDSTGPRQAPKPIEHQNELSAQLRRHGSIHPQQALLLFRLRQVPRSSRRESCSLLHSDTSPCSAATSLSCNGNCGSPAATLVEVAIPAPSRQSRLPFRSYVPTLALAPFAPASPFRAPKTASPPTTSSRPA